MLLRFTKNQTLILDIFFNNPEKSYYLRQLAKMLGKEPGVFQLDINRLVEDKILISRYQANSRFFKLNKQYPLYKELRNIFLKTFGVIKKLKESLKDIKGIKIAFIFGSYAKAKESILSDIDLMIIGEINEDKLIPEVTRIENKIDREINYHIFSTSDWKKKIKEKNSFLVNILSQPKIFLIGNENELSRIS